MDHGGEGDHNGGGDLSAIPARQPIRQSRDPRASSVQPVTPPTQPSSQSQQQAVHPAQAPSYPPPPKTLKQKLGFGVKQVPWSAWQGQYSMPTTGVPIDPAGPPPTIELRGVSKSYGQFQGLTYVNLSFHPGVTAVVGPNGAGKSTMIKLIMGLIRPSIGDVSMLDRRPGRDSYLYEKVGYCPEHDAFFTHMTGSEFLIYILRLHGYTKEEAERRSDILLDKLELLDVKDRTIGTYSRGMKQKMKFARAIAFDPEIIILDEPLQGTDPYSRHIIVQNIKDWGKKGKTVLFSSHILSEVEMVTKTIVLINGGKVLAQGSVSDIRALLDRYPHRIWVMPRDIDERRRLGKVFLEEDMVETVTIQADPPAVVVHTRQPTEFYSKLPKILVREKVKVDHISSPDDSLEVLYSLLMGGQG